VHALVDVEPDQVHQAERAEPESGGIDQDPVDRREIGDAFDSTRRDSGM
jgi:hypothetical protein